MEAIVGVGTTDVVVIGADSIGPETNGLED